MGEISKPEAMKLHKFNGLKKQESEPDTTYQVYLNGQWIADCKNYEEAETVANEHANNDEGRIDFVRVQNRKP